jgi:hypothetical protein
MPSGQDDIETAIAEFRLRTRDTLRAHTLVPYTRE